MSGSSFSSGYSFVYHHEMRGNHVIQESYTMEDLFIESGKYLTLKEEILLNTDNEIENMKTWTERVILKANQFIHTTKVKNMKVDED